MFGGEIAVLQYLQSIRTGFLNVVFEGITLLGEESLMVVLVAYFYFLYNKQLAKKLFFISVFSAGMNVTIKNLCKIPRPFASGQVQPLRPQTATGYSFPSGHTQNTATWLPGLAMHVKKGWFWLVALAAAVLVGFSRLYLGVHYPSDVIAGLLLGLLFAVCGSWLYDRIAHTNRLHAGACLVLLPAAVYYFIEGDPNCADLFKVYGMLLGFSAATAFEDKWVQFDCRGPLWKRLIRAVVAIVLAVAIKESLKWVLVTANPRLDMVFALLRYCALCLVAFGLCPWAYKKRGL